MLKDFKPRLYQETIFATASLQNTLVVLPTGLGKTGIALMLTAHRLLQYPQSKVVILAPTKPLVEQHLETMRNHLPWSDEEKKEKISLCTGFIKPEKRVELWKKASIIITTPQGLENDIIGSKLSLENVSLLVIDEAHRAVGEYSYVWLAQQYEKTARWPRILALTASPGDTLEKINEIILNLSIKELEVRIDSDLDVKPYVQEIDINWIEVKLPETLQQVHKYLQICFNNKLQEIKQLGYTAQNMGESRTEMLKLQAHLQGEIASGDRTPGLMKSVSLGAEALKVQHALELIETQGVEALKIYLEDIENQARTSKIKAVQNLVKDGYFRSALMKARMLYEQKIEHPKMDKIKEIVKEKMEQQKDAKIIIFSTYRDTGNKIVNEINKTNEINETNEINGTNRINGNNEINETNRINGNNEINNIDKVNEMNMPNRVKARHFIGQASKRTSGLSQKEQVAMLEEFRQGLFHVLVSSSVGEEGLDIPQVDLVIFYEPTPSSIRHIQRVGRTGRQKKGSVIVLITKGTRDEGYRWSAHHKQLRMYRTLKELKKNILLKDRTQEQGMQTAERVREKEESLKRFFEQSAVKEEQKKISIIADYREKASGVIKECIALGAAITLKQLESADYILSDRIGVEFKTQEDFVDSLLDGRILKQMRGLRENFPRPLLIVEGERDIYTIRNVHPNAIRGLLGSVAIDFAIPIIYTRNFRDTAAMLFSIAKREQLDLDKSISLHGDRKPITHKELQEFIVSTLPNVGTKLAIELLKKFKSIKGIMNATEEELKEIALIGDVKAKKIKEIIERVYNEYE